jgi:hypothetical protein
LLGAFIGVVLGHAFVLDLAEALAWKLFWMALMEGNFLGIGVLLASSTFWKTLGCAALGALIAAVLTRKKTTGVAAVAKRAQSHSEAPGR